MVFLFIFAFVLCFKPFPIVHTPIMYALYKYGIYLLKDLIFDKDVYYVVSNKDD